MTSQHSKKQFIGKSFKGNDKLGEELRKDPNKFENADIRGADFTGQILNNANFKGVTTGLHPKWEKLVILTCCIMSFISGIIAGVAGIFIVCFICKNLGTFQLILSLIFIAFLWSITFKINLITGFLTLVLSAALAIALVIFFTIIGQLNAHTIFAWQSLNFAVAAAGSGAIIFAACLIEVLAVSLARVISCPSIDNISRVEIITYILPIFVSLLVVLLGNNLCGIGGNLTKFKVIDILIAWFISLSVVALSFFIIRRAFSEEKNKKDTWIRSFVTNFLAQQGTSFRNTQLNNTNFTNAKLNNADFSKTTLNCTYWRGAKLEYACLDDKKLNNPKIRQLLITSQHEKGNFDRLDLSGLNLSDTDLTNCSFIETNFYSSNLQKAKLQNSKLVRAKFESADLRGATLSGACIEDWLVTQTTVLTDVICDHIFIKYSNNHPRDQRNFQPGGFKTFIKTILSTIELYHNQQDIDPGVALTVIDNLSQIYSTELQIIGIKRTENGINLIVKCLSLNKEEQEEIKEEYKSLYTKELSFKLSDPYKYLPTYDNLEEKLQEMQKICDNIKSSSSGFVIVDNPNNLTFNGNIAALAIGNNNVLNGIYNDYSSDIDYSLINDQSEFDKKIQQHMTILQQGGDSQDKAINKVAHDLAKQARNNPGLKEKLKNWANYVSNAATSGLIGEGTVQVLKLALQLAGIPLP